MLRRSFHSKTSPLFVAIQVHAACHRKWGKVRINTNEQDLRGVQDDSDSLRRSARSSNMSGATLAKRASSEFCICFILELPKGLPGHARQLPLAVTAAKMQA